MEVSDPQGKGRLRGRTPGENTQSQIAAATWRIETRSDSALSEITLEFFGNSIDTVIAVIVSFRVRCGLHVFRKSSVAGVD